MINIIYLRIISFQFFKLQMIELSQSYTPEVSKYKVRGENNVEIVLTCFSAISKTRVRERLYERRIVIFLTATERHEGQ